jgi:hypothetical protein
MRLDDEPEVRAPHQRRGMRADTAMEPSVARPASSEPDRYCPACGAEVLQEKCKVVCRSESCLHRVIYTCSEF